jgi:hypothetical protein
MFIFLGGDFGSSVARVKGWWPFLMVNRKSCCRRRLCEQLCENYTASFNRSRSLSLKTDPQLWCSPPGPMYQKVQGSENSCQNNTTSNNRSLSL